MPTPPAIFLVSTPQRCGSTWLVKMLSGMAGSRDMYLDGLALGFGLTGSTEPDAIRKLTNRLRRDAGVRILKTHDVPSGAFDALCSEIPELRVLTMHRDFRDTVVSRYFYLRYYWRTDPRLRAPSAEAMTFLSEIGESPDHEALETLLESAIVRDWAREWMAFETPFKTPRAVRVTYAGMVDESEFPKLSEFTALPLRKGLSFGVEQRQETKRTGRDGKARFNRRGLVGEWREWWTEEQGAWLVSLVGVAESCKPTGKARSSAVPK